MTIVALSIENNTTDLIKKLIDGKGTILIDANSENVKPVAEEFVKQVKNISQGIITLLL